MGPSMGMRLSRSKAALKLAVNEPVPAMAEKRSVLLLLTLSSDRALPVRLDPCNPSRNEDTVRAKERRKPVPVGHEVFGLGRVSLMSQ
jgi:hypothetical protein